MRNKFWFFDATNFAKFNLLINPRNIGMRDQNSNPRCIQSINSNFHQPLEVIQGGKFIHRSLCLLLIWYFWKFHFYTPMQSRTDSTGRIFLSIGNTFRIFHQDSNESVMQVCNFYGFWFDFLTTQRGHSDIQKNSPGNLMQRGWAHSIW